MSTSARRSRSVSPSMRRRTPNVYSPRQRATTSHNTSSYASGVHFTSTPRIMHATFTESSKQLRLVPPIPTVDVEYDMEQSASLAEVLKASFFAASPFAVSQDKLPQIQGSSVKKVRRASVGEVTPPGPSGKLPPTTPWTAWRSPRAQTPSNGAQPASPRISNTNANTPASSESTNVDSPLSTSKSGTALYIPTPSRPSSALMRSSVSSASAWGSYSLRPASRAAPLGDAGLQMSRSNPNNDYASPPPSREKQPTPKDNSVAKTLGHYSNAELRDPIVFLKWVKERHESFEFVYLTYKTNSKFGTKCIYDLQIVPYTELDFKEYFTLSPAGIIHYKAEGQEFIPIEQWLKEKEKYDSLASVSFLRNFRLRKCFYKWRAIVHEKHAHHRAHLQRMLLTVVTQLRTAIFKVRALCLETEGALLLVKQDRNMSYDLEEFINKQERRKEVASTQLNEFLKEVVALTLKACQEVVSENGGLVPREATTLEDEKQLQTIKRLKYFIRLVQYHVTNTYLNIVLNSTRHLLVLLAGDLKSDLEQQYKHYTDVLKLHLVKRRSKQNLLETLQRSIEDTSNTIFCDRTGTFPLFNIHISVQSTPTKEIIIAPQLDELSKALQLQITQEFASTMDSLPWVTDWVRQHHSCVEEVATLTNQTQAQIRSYINNYSNPAELSKFRNVGQPIAEILKRHGDSKRLSRQIREVVNQCYGRVQQLAHSLQPFLDIFDMEGQFDLEKFLARKDPANTGAVPAIPPVSEYRQVLAVCTQHIASLEELKKRVHIGCFSIDMSALVATLLPIPTGIRGRLANVMPGIAKQLTNALYEDVGRIESVLGRRPATLPECAEWMRVLRRLQQDRSSLDFRFRQVGEFYALMSEFGVMNAIDAAALTVMTRAQQSLEETARTAEQHQYGHIQQFTPELEKKVKEVEARAAQLRAILVDPLLDAVDSPQPAVLALLGKAREKLRVLQMEAEKLNGYEQLFQQRPTEFEELSQVREEVTLREKLWKTFAEFTEHSAEWQTTNFHQLAIDRMATLLEHYSSVLSQCARGLREGKVLNHLRGLLDSYKQLLPVIEDLRNVALKQRHWQQIKEAIGKPNLEMDQSLTLQQLVELGIMRCKKQINEIASTAANEYHMEQAIAKIAQTWQDTELALVPYKESEEVYILTGVDELLAQLEDDRLTLATMQASKLGELVQPQIEEWRAKLAQFTEVMDVWLACQRHWLYLEDIFSATDIQRSLPAEAKLFHSADKKWKELMKRTFFFPNAMFAATAKQDTLRILTQCNKQLEAVLKGLQNYLEAKRAAFPRFYFLSNDELIDILAHTRKPQTVQPHLIKCFDNIARVEFSTAASGARSGNIIAMISSEDEKVPLAKEVRPRGNVEEWLAALETMMRRTIREGLEHALMEFGGVRQEEWMLKCPCAQIMLTLNQIFFCQRVTQILTEMENANAAGGRSAIGLYTYKAEVQARLRMLANTLHGRLSSYKRRLLGSLLVLEVHNRDVVKKLIKDKCMSPYDFEWQRQLRFYWDAEGHHCVIRQANASFVYGYEYLGCSPRLVITPLTDRCYLTLTTALLLSLGGAPEGPAGTGKTETTKDLAKALGRHCVVFNCSEGLDYKMMAQFFAGLVQSGAWACFDEFNRIEIEVLSVVAQQLLTIQTAIARGAEEFQFEERHLRLNRNCGFFITMNPGYAGRTELPDNLKALFRPVAMTVPDSVLIAEILLFSEGFITAKKLASKLVRTYDLCAEQLPPQVHYDFGLRAVKSVVLMAGAMRRADPSVAEEVILIRALRGSNAPKFLPADLPLFESILADMFPEMPPAPPAVATAPLLAAVRQVLHDAGLQEVPVQIEKILQLHETVQVRHGVMLVGPTGAGKTTCYSVLAAALCRLAAPKPPDPKERSNGDETAHPPAGDTSTSTAGHHAGGVVTYHINPKALTLNELYGVLDERSSEWTEGLVASVVRKAVSDTSTSTSKWIVFDGPVDALWIENMNSVLDDNKTLCLPNGERIKLTPHVAMVFEVDHLNAASPATVSRCGMVYMEPADLGWRPYARTWLDSLAARVRIDDRCRRLLWQLLDTTVDPGIAFLRRRAEGKRAGEVDAARHVVDVNLVASLTNLAECVWAHHRLGTDPNDPARPRDWRSDDDRDQTVVLCFIFAYVWSFGAVVDSDERFDFDVTVRGLFHHYTNLPLDGLLFDYRVDFDLAAFVLWTVPPFSLPLYNPNLPSELATSPAAVAGAATGVSAACAHFNNVQWDKVLVPTVDTESRAYLMEVLLAGRRPVLFVGDSATGKTAVIDNTLRELVKARRVVSHGFHLTLEVSPAATQAMLEHCLEKTGGEQATTKRVVFIDELHAPKMDKYGAQPSHELLRQLLDAGGWYDRKKLTWREVKGVMLVAAMRAGSATETGDSASKGSGGGASGREISSRFLRHFHIIRTHESSDEVLFEIYQAIVKAMWDMSAGGSFSVDAERLLEPLVRTTIGLYREVKKNLRPVPTKPHYQFTLRDVTRVIIGLVQCSLKDLEKNELLRLWYHEVLRVFVDRMGDPADRHRFLEVVVRQLRQVAKVHWKLEDLEDPSVPPVLFGDYLRLGGYAHERPYLEVKDVAVTTTHFNELLRGYQTQAAHPSEAGRLVFFPYATEHISRLARILRQPKANALLLGIGGSGKRTLARFTAFLGSYAVFEVTGSKKGYGHSEFRDDLKRVFQQAGLHDKHIVLVLSEQQLAAGPAFLEDINCLLNGWAIPGLYPPEELEPLLLDLRAAATRDRKEGRPVPLDPQTAPKDEVYAYFLDKVRRRLKVVLCMSPVGEQFRRTVMLYPSLVTSCTVDWFDPWPADALGSVAVRFFAEHEGLVGGREMARALSEVCVLVHSSVGQFSERQFAETQRRTFVTPSVYLELLEGFVHIYQAKRNELHHQRDKYRFGVQRLAETNELVRQMHGELERLTPELEATAAETKALLESMAADQDEVDRTKIVILNEEAEVAQQTRLIQASKDDAERDFVEALPALQEAVRALNTLNKNDVAEIRTFTQPPAGVVMVMEAVCIIRQVPPNWANARALLADPEVFLNSLINLDKDNISPKIVRALKKYVSNPAFSVQKIEKQSYAAKSICQWVHAIVAYSEVYQLVAPKRARLESAQRELDASRAKLERKREELAAVENKLRTLKLQYEIKQREMADLKAKIHVTRMRVQRAEKLTSALAAEQETWSKIADDLDAQLATLLGSTLLAAAALSFLGPFSGAYRRQLLAMWADACRERAVPLAGGSPQRLLVQLLGSDLAIHEWQTMGLPRDQVSVENALLATSEFKRRWPLLIDPQGEAVRWVRALEEARSGGGLRELKPTDDDFVRGLQKAVQFGQPVLVLWEPASAGSAGERIDPVLDPLLLRQTSKKGAVEYVVVGDMEVPIDRGFRLYIATKQANPAFLPEVFIRTNVINFAVTRDGLEEQLLADVVRHESPDLEKKKEELVLSIANDRRQLQALKDRILALLSDPATAGSDGHNALLDDEALINALQESKATSEVVAQRLVLAEDTERRIDAARDVYRPVAGDAALAYFALTELPTLDPMYHFSLNEFKRLFGACFWKVPAEQFPPGSAERLPALQSVVTEEVYGHVCRGLLEKHKSMFAFHLCTYPARARGAISPEEWDFLVHGTVRHVQADRRPPPKPPVEWLSLNTWTLLHGLAELAPFQGLADDLAQNLSGFKGYAKAADIQRAALPEPWQSRLNDFQKLLMVRCFRLEKLPAAVADYVAAHLGEKFLQRPPFDLEKFFEDSSNDRPIVFILTPDADPTDMLLKFAAERQCLLHVCSLGQGQGQHAEALVSAATKTGTWVLLQNCHLAASWLPRLEKLVDSLRAGAAVHPKFRLWLTSMPTVHFPVSVLQASLKLTNEPPQGLRANLYRSFRTMAPLIDMPMPRPVEWRKLLLGLVYFHAVAQERKKYGPIGWSVPYGFSEADLRVAFRILELYLRSASGDPGEKLVELAASSGSPLALNLSKLRAGMRGVPWDALRYLIAEVTYGGKVTDKWDRRLLLAMLDRFFGPHVLVDGCKFSASGVYKMPEEGVAALLLLSSPHVAPVSSRSNISARSRSSDHAAKAAVPAPAGHSKLVEAYVQAIEALPRVDDPEVFGLHENVSIVLNRNEARAALHYLSLMQPKLSAFGSNNEAATKVLKMIGDWLADFPDRLAVRTDKRLPSTTTSPAVSRPTSGRSIKSARQKPAEEGNEEESKEAQSSDADSADVDPFAVLLRQEISRYNQLLGTIESSLLALQSALLGQSLFTASLEAMFHSLANNKLPDLWRQASYPTARGLEGWMADLHARLAYIRKWTNEGPPPVFWLAGFFFPQGFLTAVLQRHCRATNVPVDTLTFETHVLDKMDQQVAFPAPSGVYISGLYMDGARWNRANNCIVESNPTQLRNEMPVIWLNPVQNYEPNPNHYICPVYLTADRAGAVSTRGLSSNYITSVPLNTQEPASLWTLRGVALIGQPIGE